MRIELARVDELSSAHARLWDTIRGDDNALASPFFSLQFARVAAQLRPAEVAVIEVGNQVRGFWAFERRRMGLAVPLAYPVSDHHGPIVTSELELPIGRLLRACRSQLFWFAGLPARQRLFSRFHRSTAQSPIVRLEHLKLSDQRRKWQRLQREVGDVRFEVNCQNPRILEQLIVWKRAQAARTQFGDPYEDPWARTLLHELHTTQTPDMRGLLSVLWAGDKPVAAHFGLASRRAWHWWVPSYDPAFARHSPGLLMLHAMLKEARAQGIEWLDFGPGPEAFKQQMANDSLPVAFGTAFTPAAGLAIGAKRHVESALRGSSLHGALRRAVGWFGSSAGATQILLEGAQAAISAA